jgi:hypothetical protein
VRAIADAEQTFAGPAPQPVDLHGEEPDLRPVIELGDSVLQEWTELDDVALQCRQAALSDFLEAALWNDKAGLEVIAAIDQDQQLPVPEKAKRLRRIACAFR